MTILYNYPNENTVGAEENKQKIVSKEAKEDFLEEMAFELKAGRRHFRNKERHVRRPAARENLGSTWSLNDTCLKSERESV